MTIAGVNDRNFGCFLDTDSFMKSDGWSDFTNPMATKRLKSHKFAGTLLRILCLLAATLFL